MKSKRSSKKDSKISATFSSRLPERTAMVQLLAACVVPIQLWATLNLLREVPALMLWVKIWDIIGIIAYTQAFALLESIALWLLLIGIALVLPAGWLRDKLAVRGTIFIFATAAWAAVAHSRLETFLAWRSVNFAAWLPLYLASIFIPLYLLSAFPKTETVLNNLMGRLVVLASLYIIIGGLSLVIVLLRNFI